MHSHFHGTGKTIHPFIQTLSKIILAARRGSGGPALVDLRRKLIFTWTCKIPSHRPPEILFNIPASSAEQYFQLLVKNLFEKPLRCVLFNLSKQSQQVSHWSTVCANQARCSCPKHVNLTSCSRRRVDKLPKYLL